MHKHLDFPMDLIEAHDNGWLEMEFAPPTYTLQQLDEFDRLTEAWVKDHERQAEGKSGLERTPTPRPRVPHRGRPPDAPGSKTRAFVESTQRKPQLFTLPSYSPELNPDVLLWRHVKAHRVGRMGIRNLDELEAAVRVTLRSLSRMPHKISAFFNATTTRYAFAT